jgi:S-adenosylhomocysteine hydrolase
MTAAVHPVPKEIDDAVARAALRTYGAHLDVLNQAQIKYLSGWQVGT